jgi:threonine dehydrogenase-like Zn-dependent dehydrogenase
MKAATWLGADRFEIGDVPDPKPGPDQVVVKVDTVGVCGTDVHITQGLFPSTPPAILGHEASGVIVETGSAVPKSRIGERVAMDTTSHCGECESCRTWSWSRCERAVKSSGFFAQYSVLPAQSAHRIPDGMSLETGALTEPASCCLSGVSRLNIPEKAVAVVIGGGIMGQFTLAFLKSHGVETVIMSEMVKSRREIARDLGADVLHDPSQGDIGELVKDLTHGRGAHIAAEAVGKAQLVAKCAEITRPRGDVLMIGVCPQGAHLPVDLYDFHYKEVRLQGAFGRGNVFHKTPEAISKLKLDSVISGCYELKDVGQAIKDSGAGKGIKLVIKPNG